MEINFAIVSVHVLCLYLAIGNVINTATSPSPAAQEGDPVIYVTFTRWENRTFSPRIYYLMLQKYGLTNKLLDLNNEYHKYLTEMEQRPQNPPVNIVFKSKPKRPASDPNPEQLADRTALRILNRKKGYLHFRNKDDRLHTPSDKDVQLPTSASVVFPTGTSASVPPLHVSNFFSDRIAYPGTSGRRTTSTPLGDRKESTSGQLVSPGIFDQLGTESLSQKFTSDDVVDTASLLVDIIKYSDWDDQNAVFSPFSLANILALLFLGSNGTTFTQLGAQLKRTKPIRLDNPGREMRFHVAFRMLLNYLNGGSTQNVAVTICNRILIDKEFPLLDSYKQDAIQFYDAQSDSFDFENQAEDVMKTVNNWVSYKTNGKIPSIINSPPSEETTLMLLNAVYFRGDWEVPFIKEITQKKPFYVSPRETLEVSMMTNLLNLPYLETQHFRVCGIPYKGKGVGLFVMLPTNPGVKGLKEMEKEMTLENLMQFGSMKKSQVTIQIPRMRMESEAQVKDLLSNFGLGSIFSPKTANFSRISDTRGLYVSSILHKSIFEMNEEGVSAAAVTVATGDRTLDDRPTLFTVNRPFCFLIMNIKAKTILFFGRVTRPLPLEDN